MRSSSRTSSALLSLSLLAGSSIALAQSSATTPTTASTPPPASTTSTSTTTTTAADPQRRTGELPIPVQVERLNNGLRVVLSSDRSTPTVGIAVYYDVGGRVEERGRSGFAHLFEHMMFEGSANVPRGQFDQLIARYGGSSNGTTSEDRTNYYETLPSNALELGLFLEADRMRALNVTRESFENQRTTVLEERRQSYENEPYALSILRRDELVYGSYFPYAHSVIGDVADLQSATFEQVRDFHDRYYVPNNAVLSISGDFDVATAMTLVRRHFDAIPQRPLPAWTPPPYAPQTAERVDRITDQHADLPGFHLVYQIPPRRTPDHYALELLALALADGESSRLYQELVKDREIANSIEADTEDRRGPDLFAFWCVLANGHTTAEARAVIDRQLTDIARNSITGRELEKVRNRIRSRFVFGLQTNLSRAQRLAEFEMYDGNASLLRTELDRYLSVTAEDIRRVAATYFTAQNRTLLDVVPAAQGSTQTPASATPPASASTATPGNGGAR